MRKLFSRIAGSARSNRFIRRSFRSVKMRLVRQLYGFKNVHHTFYLGGKGGIASDLVAGAFSYIGKGASICPKVEIGAYTLLAHEVSILGGDHFHDKPGVPICFSGRPELPRTIIADDVWIGHRVTIKAGVNIARGAVVAAGAVVTKDIPEYSIVGGIPAVVIGARFPDPHEREIHNEMLNRTPREGELPGQRVAGVTGN